MHDLSVNESMLFLRWLLDLFGLMECVSCMQFYPEDRTRMPYCPNCESRD